ncbi:MAG: histidine kinase dimerization/phospho-acceptor domain-containing protein, partial [Hungatella sp.]
MKKKIYWNLCLIALVAVVLSSALTTVIYYRNLETQMKREVITEARYLEVGIELSGATFLDTLAEKGRMARPSRMTLIAQDGVVLYDNYAAPKTMENHKNRPEVADAMEKGSGAITRTSATLSEKTFYYALRLQDGSVLRVANTTGSVLAAVWHLIPMMGFISVLIVLLSMLLAEGQTRHIVKPINELDLDHPEENQVYDELAPLIGKIERQQHTIQKQMETLKAKQEEFTAITEHMKEGFLVVDKKAEVVSYNSSAMQILGINRPHPEEVGMNILNFNRSQIFRHAVDEALMGHHSEQTMDISGRFYQIIANPVTEGTAVNGAIIVILDVTEKQEREGLRREFSANVSHELKTPLTSISGYAEIMKNGLVKPEDMKHFSENIYI